MANNIPKKLAIKAELLRHLETAQQMLASNHPSSVIKVVTLQADLAYLELGAEPDLPMWRLVMAL